MNLYVLKCFEYKSALLRVAYSGGKEERKEENPLIPSASLVD
jgi:hypothetical protein